MSNPETSLPPGFRFHPTDEELILHYLKKKAGSTPCPVSIIAEVDIYKFDPWDLPAQATFGEKEWYFFSPRDRKYPNGARPNRAAVSGYWKATGTDKLIMATSSKNENIGVKKALVFYKGRPPKGLKTGWIMHEYRLAEALTLANNRPIKPKQASMRLDDWVLCRIYKKNHSPQNGRQPQEEDPSTIEEDVSNGQSNLHYLHKSSSFSDLLASADFSLLSRFLLDNPSDSTPSQLSPIFPNSSNLNQLNSNIHCYPSLQEPMAMAATNVIAMESQLKRQRQIDGIVQHPYKKANNTNTTFINITNKLENSQYHLLNSQAMYNQQILLNSHLQFQ